jgi:glycine/D-amino acid oxidase-like deaminating enzyme
VHPLRLVHAVARACVDAGVALHTGTTVLGVEPGPRVVTRAGAVRAAVVVLATEAWTAADPTRHRDLIPLYSLMVGSAPLTDDQWAAVGLAGRPTFNDARNLIVYGQRTADGRIAFGGRGATYPYASRLSPTHDTDRRVRDHLVAAVRELYPALEAVEFPFHWGGPLGVPRDWRFTVRYDRAAGIAVAGGYVGDGVSTTNLAGRTLADLITGRDTDLVRLPWVDHRSPRWEREPLRWLGVNAGRIAAGRADAAESGSSRAARWRAAAWGRVLATLTGH